MWSLSLSDEGFPATVGRSSHFRATFVVAVGDAATNVVGHWLGKCQQCSVLGLVGLEHRVGRQYGDHENRHSCQ